MSLSGIITHIHLIQGAVMHNIFMVAPSVDSELETEVFHTIQWRCYWPGAERVAIIISH